MFLHPFNVSKSSLKILPGGLHLANVSTKKFSEFPSRHRLLTLICSLRGTIDLMLSVTRVYRDRHRASLTMSFPVFALNLHDVTVLGFLTTRIIGNLSRRPVIFVLHVLVHIQDHPGHDEVEEEEGKEVKGGNMKSPTDQCV